MLSLQLPTVSPLSKLISLQNSHHRNTEKNPFSSLVKLRGTAGKRTGEGPNLHECFKSRLAAASGSAADAGTDDRETVIQLPGELRPELMPKHVAIILDGNGRWAKRRGLPVEHGHKAGSMTLKRLVSSCCELGLKALTVFIFSTENWKRPKVEVDFLMSIIEDFIRIDVKELIERHGIRTSAIGNISRLPESVQSAISSTEELSKANRGMHFVSALSYSGRYDIAEATKKIARQVEQGILRAEDVDEALFREQLTTNLVEPPDPDLVIRTSGELRLSNFLLWQLAYAQLYFSDKMFPDFGEDELVQALTSFQQGQRRRYIQRNNQD